jgi:hypothetical protein
MVTCCHSFWGISKRRNKPAGFKRELQLRLHFGQLPTYRLMYNPIPGQKYCCEIIFLIFPRPGCARCAGRWNSSHRRVRKAFSSGTTSRFWCTNKSSCMAYSLILAAASFLWSKRVGDSRLAERIASISNNPCGSCSKGVSSFSGSSGVSGSTDNTLAWRAPPANRSDGNRTWFRLHSFIAFWVVRSWAFRDSRSAIRFCLPGR